MIRRLIALLVSLALMVGAAVVIGRIVLVPVAEGRIEDSVSRSFGAPADASIDPPLGPELLGGAVGDVRVRLPGVTRQAVEVEDIDVRMIDAHLDVRSLIDGTAEVRFARIAFTGTISAAALTTELRRRLVAAGVPGAARSVVTVTTAGVRVHVPGADPIAVRVRASGETLKVEAVGADLVSSVIAAGIRGPVRLGRFPYGIRVLRVRPAQDGLVVSGGRAGGTEIFR